MPSGWRPLGTITVTTAGIPQRLTSKRADPTLPISCYSIFIQQVSTNVGLLAIGPSTVKYSTLTDILAFLPIASTSSVPELTLNNELQTSQRFNPADYYVDVSSSGDKFIVSVVTDEDV